MLLVIIVLIIPMLHSFITLPLLEITSAQFTEFLGNALTLLIGVEFVKMLAKHTAENPVSYTHLSAYLLVRGLPIAAITALLTQFSDAISSIWEF